MSLAKFIDQRNATNRVFRAPLISRPTSPEQCKPLFLSLAAALSPENLSCDGELSRAKVAARYKVLKRAWGELEVIFGRTVTETEAYSWHVPDPRGAVGTPLMDDLPNYIFVDVDDKIVNVYDHNGEIDAVCFVPDKSYVDSKKDRIVDDPRGRAIIYAKSWAEKLGIDWGTNE